MLRQMGATVAARAGSGSPYVAHIAASDLERLAAMPGVTYVEASRPYRPVVDASVPAIGAVEAWKLSGPSSQPLTGHGVLVAVVDTGVDWSHLDLRNADGTTRILHLLDQTCSVTDYAPCATTGTVSPAGREWAASDINGWLTVNQLPGQIIDTATGALLPDDTFPGATCDVTAGCGHGTHIASVAAGTGYSHDSRTFRGVAPDADLLIVRSDLESASIMRAWSWIVEKAKALGRPVVILNAFGSDFGPHDGTDSVERELDRLSGSGVIFVVAAGNAGNGLKHASGTVADGTSSTFAFQLTAEGVGSFSLWYPATEQWKFSLFKAGSSDPVATVSPGEQTSDIAVQDGSATTTFIVDAAAAPHPVHTTLNHLALTVSRPTGGQSGAWLGELRRISGSGTVRWDAWTTAGELAFYRTGLGGTTGGQRHLADADRAGQRRPRHHGSRLHHAPDVALRRPPPAHAAIVYDGSPKSCNTGANSWWHRALQFAGAHARRAQKTRSHRAGPADHRGASDSGPDTKSGALRQYPSGDASRHQSGRRARGRRYRTPTASQPAAVTGGGGSVAPQHSTARRVHRRAHGHRYAMEHGVGRWQAASPPRRPDGDCHDPYGHADTHAHPHTDQYPYLFTHRDCYRHKHPHGHCYRSTQAYFGLTTCTAQR